MKPINLKHKNKDGSVTVTEYYPVHERVKEFRNREEFKDWSIETELLYMAEEYCVVKAYVKAMDGSTISTGHSIEFRKASNINMYSFVENAETSAVGRALGFLGIGIDAGIASEQEMTKGLPLEQPMTDAQALQIETLLQNSMLDENILKSIEVGLNSFSISRAAKAIEYLKENQKQTLDQEFKSITK